MALTLIKEDGSGKADANSYANLADGDAYHDGHLYATAWSGATGPNREVALVMATRLIDAYMEFGGSKTTGGQALQWPRYGCPDPDSSRPGNPLVGWISGPGCFDSASLPAALVLATCEQARCLLAEDLTEAPAGEGLISSALAGMKTVFDRTGQPAVLCRVARRLLSKLGTCLGDRGGMTRLVRV
jgi:hypothetical protein